MLHFKLKDLVLKATYCFSIFLMRLQSVKSFLDLVVKLRTILFFSKLKKTEASFKDLALHFFLKFITLR